MKKALLSVVMLFILASLSVRAQELTPLEFNDKLAAITDSLYAHGQAWGVQFNKAYNGDKDFASLTASREALERYVDSKIRQVKAMKDVKNSNELRMAMISFLNFEKNMVTLAFKPLEQLKSDASAEEVQAALDKMTELSKQESGELEKVALAQENYANSNGFEIAPVEEE